MRLLPYHEKPDRMRGKKARPHQLRNWRDKMYKPDEGFVEVTVG